jgi:uncharacterized damage-inducible protein DinB
MIRNDLLAEFDHEVATTRRLLERLPENAERLAWKPHAKSKSLGGLATHIAHLPVWGLTIMSTTSFDLAAMPPNAPEMSSRAHILAAFDESAQNTRSRMDRTDAEYQERWTLKRSDQELFSMPRAAAFRTFLLYHLVHHRGQLSVYLRLQNIPVPPVYGPTADEG